jgi:hypothetical protein
MSQNIRRAEKIKESENMVDVIALAKIVALHVL